MYIQTKGRVIRMQMSLPDINLCEFIPCSKMRNILTIVLPGMVGISYPEVKEQNQQQILKLWTVNTSFILPK